MKLGTKSVFHIQPAVAQLGSSHFYMVIATTTATASETVFSDADAPLYSRRFYRVAEEPPIP